jgi:ribosome biogenesis GTPase
MMDVYSPKPGMISNPEGLPQIPMAASFPENANARVIMVAGKRCRLELAGGRVVDAIARGKLYEGEEGGEVVVGDVVHAEEHHGNWMVESVLPRSNEFVREGLRKERQVLFANADRVLILASLSQPETKTAAMDRFLVSALHGNVPPMLVLTKTDLDAEGQRTQKVKQTYESFDLPVFALSNVTGEGVEALAEHLQEGITALVGNSGVGKSSLLNRLIPGLDLRVSDVSSWSGKGVHTTTAAVLVPYGKRAAMIDTAGMKSFVPYGITRDNLEELFPDISRFAPDCRFRDCRHLSEPDCAVRAAAEKGDLSGGRLRSYYRLLEELA